MKLTFLSIDRTHDGRIILQVDGYDKRQYMMMPEREAIRLYRQEMGLKGKKLVRLPIYDEKKRS